MNYQYIALLIGILVFAFFIYRILRGAREKLGKFGLFLAVMVLIGLMLGITYYAANSPWLVERAATLIGTQIILAIVGLLCAVIVTGGLMLGLGGGRKR